MLKIVYCYQYFGTPQGSWSTRVYEVCRRWVTVGHQVTVVTAPYEKSDIRGRGLISRQEVQGIQVIVINAADNNRETTWLRAIRALQFSLLATWFAMTLSYDRIICSSGPITIGIPGILARWLRRKRMIFEVRDLWPAGGIEMGKLKGLVARLALGFEKLCYRNAAVVVTASPGQEEHIRRRFPKIKTLVIPNASDPDLFGASTDDVLPAWADKGTLFTHIGSLGFIHNCRLLVDAARVLAQRGRDDILLVFLGEGAERAELEALSASYGVANVRFFGLVPKRALPVWVQKSCATLFSTLNNPVQNASSPNKVFDSFAAGTPVIQTTTGWIRELIENERCGLNVPPGDPEALADAMVYLAGHSQERKVLSENALRLARTTFNRDVLAERYLEGVVLS